MSVLAPLRVSEAADSLAKASTPQPFSTSKTSNWVARAGGLPDYIQHVAHGILRSDPAGGESGAIQKAIGVVKNWAAGGGKVDAGTKAAAAKAVAEWEAKKGANAAKSAVRESVAPSIATLLHLERDAVGRIVVLEQAFGADGLISLLAEGMLAEAAAPTWAPVLKRTASSSSEIERHEVHDNGQQVGSIARRKSYDKGRPDRFTAHAVNGDRVTDYSGGSKPEALEALRKHLEEAPARVAPHGGKFLVARPASYSGPDTYSAYPSQSAARYAAGLPEQPSTPEMGSQVQALAEMLRFDLMTISGLDIPALRRVQEARRADPFELVEGFASGELRNFRGEWERGGSHLAKLTPSSVRPGASRVSVSSPAAARYEGGVVRASARARIAHAAKPQIAPKQPKDGPRVLTLADAVGTGAWTRSAASATTKLKAQRVLEGENLADSTVQMPDDVVYADPDIVRTQLPEYQALVKAGRSDASSLTHEEASFLAKQLTRVALARQHHILIDTVGDSGKGKFAAKIEDAKRAGHQVSVHYATTDIQTALKRAAVRAEETGRAVPEDYLRSSHREVSRRFIEDISKIKGIHLRVVDTTERPNKVIAERRPADDKLRIKDEERFHRFLLKGK